MQQSERRFFQSLTVNDVEFPLNALNRISYIESTQLDSPQLLLVCEDKYGLIQDLLQLKEDSESAEVLFSDSFRDDAQDYKAKFLLLSAKTTQEYDGRIELSLMEEPAFNLLKRGRKIYTKATPRAVLRDLTQVDVEMEDVPKVNDFHLIDQRKSNLIRRMCSEYGRLGFFSRGQFFFQTPQKLMDSEADIEYEYGNPVAENKIENYEVISNAYLMKELSDFEYSGWQIEKGAVRPPIKPTKAVRITPFPVQYTLKNLASYIVPAVDLMVEGDFRLTVGAKLSLKWHTGLAEMPLHESFPTEILITRLSHFEKGNQFKTRIIGAVLPEQD